MSTDCENLLRKFLVLNPAKRASLETIMKDKWMNMGYEDDELKPYIEPMADLKDQKRIGKTGTVYNFINFSLTVVIFDVNILYLLFLLHIYFMLIPFEYIFIYYIVDVFTLFLNIQEIFLLAELLQYIDKICFLLHQQVHCFIIINKIYADNICPYKFFIAKHIYCLSVS